MNVTLIGDESDIGRGLKSLLEKDGHEVTGWHRYQNIPDKPWNLVILCVGKVGPVGNWWEQKEIGANIESNLLLPFRVMQYLWPYKMPDASVCFMAGSNPQKIMKGYASYNVSKMALLKLCEQLDYESPECKFFALGPGYMDTKIHNATKEKNWPNPRIKAGNPGKIEDVYETLKWCWSQPKEVVGGRNICVSDIKSGRIYNSITEDVFKLRRVE